jgi:hypothetical protein
MNKTKFAIGCLVQWYEVAIISEYIETLKEAVEEYDGEVVVDIAVVVDQTLEKCTSKEKHLECKQKILNTVRDIEGCKVNIIDNLYTIADYRREFNDKYCEQVDVLVWGESDMLVPKQMFTALNTLHQNVNTPKYLATFGICKMWDNSWEPLEHPEFTNMPFEDVPGSEKNWWMLNYIMSKEEMNKFNAKVENLDVINISPHKFNGCGLVISSEVIKSGVNIPRSVFFVHEDTAFMLMTQKVLGNIPQYHFRNILLVHNRKHTQKRKFIVGEENIDDLQIGQKRRTHNWYTLANKICEQNTYNLFNPNFKALTWNSVFKK